LLGWELIHIIGFILLVLLFWSSKCPRNTSKRSKNPAAVNCRWISSYSPTVVNYRWGYFSNLLVLLKTSECHKNNCLILSTYHNASVIGSLGRRRVCWACRSRWIYPQMSKCWDFEHWQVTQKSKFYKQPIKKITPHLIY